MTEYLFKLVALFFIAGVACNEESDQSGNLSLEKRVRLLETILEQQYVTNQRLDDRVSELEQTVSDLQEDKPGMSSNASRDRQSLTETDLEMLNGTLGNVTAEDDYMVDLECPAVCFRQKLHKKEENNYYPYRSSRIAFHAYQSIDRCYSNREIIRYDKEAMDFGEGYTPYDGIFDAPTSGVYVFSWTVTTSRQTGWFVAELVIDGEVKGAITSDSDAVDHINRGSIHPATGLVTTYVDAGQHVFIRMMQVTGRCGTVKSDVLVRSSFSGWLQF